MFLKADYAAWVSEFQLYIKKKFDDVAVFDDVLFAFGAHEAFFFAGGFAAVLDVVVVGDDLRADEATLEVGVDDAGGGGRFPSLMDGPGVDFFGAGGEIAGEAEGCGSLCG